MQQDDQAILKDTQESENPDDGKIVKNPDGTYTFTLTEEEMKGLMSDQDDDDRYDGAAGLMLPDPIFKTHYEDRSIRILWIQEEINDKTIEIANQIIRWNIDDAGLEPQERQPIAIYFNSPGGYLDVSISISDAIRLSKTPVIGINMGECASGAALIFASCHCRMAFPNSYFLLHLGCGGTGGTYQQTKAQQKDYDHKIESMIAILMDTLGLKDRDKFEKLIDSEWFLYTNDTRLNSDHNARSFNLITQEIQSL